MVEQCSNVVPESVCQPDPAIMRQHIEKGAVTSGRGKGKISGQKNVLESHAELLQVKRRGIQPNFFCVLTALCMNQNINPLAITS